MIIGIAGTIGSGKGTVVEYLKKRGFAHYSSSGILKEMLNERQLPKTRKNMSDLANELMVEYAGGVLHFSHERAQKDGASNYILEAIHRVSEAEYVRSIGGIVVGVDADIKCRYERITKRKEGEKDEVTFEEFLNDAAREDEGKTGTGPNIREVLKSADYTIENNSTVDELYASIEEMLQKCDLWGMEKGHGRTPWPFYA